MRDRQDKFPANLQTAILQVLNTSEGQPIYLAGQWSWSSKVQTAMGRTPLVTVTSDELLEAVWSLIRQGLVYIDTVPEEARRWKYRLTESGKAAANDYEWNPDTSGDYINRLRSTVPEASPEVFQYASEAMTSYTTCCYLACARHVGCCVRSRIPRLGVFLWELGRRRRRDKVP